MSEPVNSGKILKDFPASDPGEGTAAGFRQEPHLLNPAPAAYPASPSRMAHQAMRHPVAGTGNLNLHVQEVHVMAGTLNSGDDYYLCWRKGLYVGKFELAGIPASDPAADTSNVTYITSFVP